MVAIDTDVFLIRYAYTRDPRYEVARRFLLEIRSHGPAVTLYNLMELLGQISFNMAPGLLSEWEEWLIKPNRLKLIWPIVPEGHLAEDFIKEELHARPFEFMRNQKMAFLDSLILGLAEITPEVDIFVTWNARHFRDKSSLNVLTPEEFLSSISN